MMENAVPAVSQNHDRHARAFYCVFLLSLTVVWLPFKAVAYTLPFVSIILFAVLGNSGRTLQRLITAFILFIVALAVYRTFYWSVNRPFLLQNALLFLATYGSFLFLIAIPRKIRLDPVPIGRYMRTIKLVILVQSLLGIFQVGIYVLLNGETFDDATGDIVQGTLNPLSFLTPGGNFNNQIYTINLLVLLLFYAPYAIAMRRGRMIAALGFIAVLFASVWHIFFSFLAAAVLITLYFSPSYRRLSSKKIAIFSFLLCIITVGSIFQPRNFQLVTYYLQDNISFQSPKAMITKESLTDLPKQYPWVYVIGLGPGQYGSRAGLIGTGRYFGEFTNPTKIPLLRSQSSEAFDEFVYPKWKEFALHPAIYGNSTMSRPFFSILSLLIELGYLIFAFILIGILVLIKRIKRFYKVATSRPDQIASLYSLSCGILIAFLFSISFFENYLEVAHAIFVGLLLFRYSLSYVKAHSTNSTYN